MNIKLKAGLYTAGIVLGVSGIIGGIIAMVTINPMFLLLLPASVLVTGIYVSVLDYLESNPSK